MENSGAHIRGKDELASFLQRGELRVSCHHEDWDHLERSLVCWRHRGRETTQEGAAAMVLDCCDAASWAEEKV